MTQRPYRQILAGLAISSLLWGCGGGGNSEPQTASHEATLQVDHYLDACNTTVEFLCLRVRSADSAPWTYQYEPIQGFGFQWGHRYSLQVRVTTKAGSHAADGADQTRTYELLRIVSDELQAASTPFTINSRQPQASLELGNDGRWRLLKQAVSCNAQVCADLAKAQSSYQQIQLDFDHGGAMQGALHLLAVRRPGS